MADFLVVGGGLIGLLTARELALAGAAVTLVERGRTGRESSWAGGGILSPLYPWRYPDAVTALARWSQAIYPDLAGTLLEETGVDSEWTRSGMLILDDEEEVGQALAWAGRSGAALEQVDGRRARELEPRLGEAGAAPLWLPDVAQVRNPRLVHALRLALLQAGVQVREQTEVRRLALRGGRVTGVVTRGGELQADAVVVAAGAWSGALLAGTGVELNVQPVRGQMILYRAPPGLVTRIVMRGGRYVIPRRDGRVLAGSTLEHVGFDKATTAEAGESLRQAAVGLIPALAGQPLELHWAGLRPGSRDGTPTIGPHPYVAGLFLNTGHFRNGVVLGPASARLLADLALGRAPCVAAAPYALRAA